jgi:uncharacterized integral membrane protein
MAGSTASQGSPPPASRSRWRRPDARLTRIIVAAVVVIYAVIFIALNRTKVRIHFVFFSVTTRLWVGFLLCVVLGVLLGQGVGVYRRRRATRSQAGSAGGDGGTKPSHS